MCRWLCLCLSSLSRMHVYPCMMVTRTHTCQRLKVTVFERAAKPGGLLMYGIPNMKLDKRVVQVPDAPVI